MGNPILLVAVVILSLLGVGFCAEPFRFARSLGNHMVLQRAPDAAVVWGYTDSLRFVI